MRWSRKTLAEIVARATREPMAVEMDTCEAASRLRNALYNATRGGREFTVTLKGSTLIIEPFFELKSGVKQ